jgi:HK97 family phage portal protein
MGLLDRVVERIFYKKLVRLNQDIVKAQGSPFVGKALELVNNRPVYINEKTEEYISEGYLFNPSVYSVVSFIAQKASTPAWGVYEVKNDKMLQLYKSASHDLPLYKKQAVKTKALVEIEDHELSPLFVTPNALQPWAEFIEQAIGYKLITGNTYIHCIGPRNGINAGKVQELWILPSQAVVIIAGNAIKPVAGYEMKGDRSVHIPPEEVIHLKYWTPEYYNGSFLYGLSPIRAGRRVVTKSNSSYDAMVSSFQNMGAVGMITAGDGSTEQALTEEQAEMIERRLAQKTGAKNRGKPLITSANLKWQQMGMSPADLAIIESDKMDLRTICNLYHVPSELFNDAANKTYSNTKEAGSAVYTNAVIPALTQFRDAFNKFITSRYGGKIYVDFDLSMISELQDDLNALAGALSQVWWLTPNEKRNMLDFGIDEENILMDDYWVPMGSMPMNAMMINDTVLDEAEKMLKLKNYLK